MLHSSVHGSGPDLVLLHGWGMNGAVWGRLAETLTRSFRLTLPDLPGHGHSQYAPHGTTLADWADACLDVAPASAIWIGWSLGGSVVMEAALRAPRRVTALVLVTATPRFVQGPDWPHAMPGATLAQFHAALVNDPVATLVRFLALQARGDDDARNVLRTLRQRLIQAPDADARGLDTGLDLLCDTDLRDRLISLGQPSLWLFGQHDTLVPWRCSESVSALLPAAHSEVIQGAAHAPFVSHYRTTLSLLVNFLEAFA